MQPDESNLIEPIRLRENHDFRKFMLGETISELGNAVGSFALPLGVLITTGSAIGSGVVMAAAIGGSITCSVVAGGWTDGHDRRKVLIWTSVARFATWTMMGLCLLTVGAPMLIFVPLAILGGVASALFGSAQAGALRSMLAPTQYPRAVGVIDGRNSAVDLIGAPLGGSILSLSTSLPFIGNAVTFLASALAIAAVRADLGSPSASRGVPFWTSVRGGYAYVWSRIEYRTLILASSFSNFAVNAFTFSLVLALQRNGHPNWQIGLLTSGTAVAAMGGAMMTGPALERISVARALRISGIVRVASFVGIVFAKDSVPVVVAFLALGTIFSPISNAAERSYMALTTPPHFQGRVASFEQFVGSCLVPAAPLAAGLLLASTSITFTLTVFAILAAVESIVLLASRHVAQLPHVSDLSE